MRWGNITYSDLEQTVNEIQINYQNSNLLWHENTKILPSKRIIIEIIKDIRTIMFPNYYCDNDFLKTSLELRLLMIYEKLKTQIVLAISYYKKKENEEAIWKADEICTYYLGQLSKIQNLLLKDVEAAFNGDPAANSKEEIIFSYPGFFAIFIYRLAHELYIKNVPFIPRIMSEYAHSRTGIDINAGARIGEYFFIDHGTGVVIGETTEIGNNVKVYQGITLGALSTRSGQQLKGKKRHPTIEDYVTIYAGATILGGETIIGRHSIIGGNAFIIQSIPEKTRVTVKNPQLQLENNYIQKPVISQGLKN